MKALNVKYFQYSVFYVLIKQNVNPPVFCNIFTHRSKTKYALRNENSIQEPLCRTNTFHTVDPIFGTKW